MIKLSSEDIVFEYLEGRHLTTTLTINNPSNSSYLYYKMKVSRQKYFMVKPVKGCIPPKSSETLEITLHKEISTSCDQDKFKLVYTLYEKQTQRFPTNLFSEGQPFEQKKLSIVVRGAPTQTQYRRKPNQNQYMSVVNSGNEAVFSSGNIQTLIYETENRVKKLQQDLQMYRGLAKTNSTNQTISKKSKLPTLILSFVSLGLGYVIGFFV